MSKADGSVIIDTKMDTEGVQKGTEEIKEELGDVGESSQKASDTIGGDLVSGFKKLGSVIAASQIVEKLVEFGKEAIELGSDLEEVQNVVDVTFTTMSKQVNKFAKEAQKTAGLSETMAKQYVGTFGAMADSFGFTEQEAYEMSTALTQLTGDVASFYNLSQEEAATKLKGVFTGETEALKELGVVMTQTALDSYAMANGFGKTTSAMTEQEKVALRYQFVMDQLSAASGDFVRTQDSWANQSKVLALQWESLMATLGSGLIDVLSPGIEFLNNTVLPAINEFAEDFAEAMSPKPSEELRKSMNDFEDAVDSANKEFKETSKTIDINAIKAELYKNQLEELEETGLDTAESQQQYANAVNALNEIYPDLNLKIDENTGLMDENSRAQLQNLETMKQRALYAAQMEQYEAQLQAWAAATQAVSEAQTQLQIIENERTALETLLYEQTGMTIDQLHALYNAHMQNAAASQIGNDNAALTIAVYELMGNAIGTLTQEQSEWLRQILALETEETALNNTIAEGKEKVNEFDVALEEAGEQMGVYADESVKIADSQGTVSEEVANTADNIKKLREEYSSAKESARESIDSQIGMFDKLEAKSNLSAETIVENWKSQQAGFEQYKQDLQKAVELGLDETLVKQLSDGSIESMAILNNLVSDTDLNIDEFNETFRKTEQAREEVSGVMAGIQTDLEGRFREMYNSIDGAWGDISYATKLAIDEMSRTINSLRGKTIYIDTYYRTYGKSSGSSSGSSSYSAYSQTRSVPYLASGAVIPPNAPFLAVLGDQRRGTNIEAPLSTIQEAVAAVMGDQLGVTQAGLNALLTELQMLRETVSGIELGDSVIGEAAERYNHKMSIARGG